MSSFKRTPEPTYTQSSGDVASVGPPGTLYGHYLQTGLPHPCTLPFGLRPGMASFSNIQHKSVAAAEMYWNMQHHNLINNQQAQAAATGQPSHEAMFMAHERERERQTVFQQPSGPSLQQMEQGPPATPGPISLPRFPYQAGLQGYANRSAQQQQQQQQQQMPSQQQQQQYNLNMIGRYSLLNGPVQMCTNQVPPTGPFGGLQFLKTTHSQFGPSSSTAQYMSGQLPHQTLGNKSNYMMSFSGSTGINSPRYPTTIQRPTAPTGNMQQYRPPFIRSSGPPGAPAGGLGVSLHFTSGEKELSEAGINSGENFKNFDKIALQVGFLNVLLKIIIEIVFLIGNWQKSS